MCLMNVLNTSTKRGGGYFHDVPWSVVPKAKQHLALSNNQMKMKMKQNKYNETTMVVLEGDE